MVKLIVEAPVTDNPVNVLMLINDLEESVFNASQDELKLILPGIQTPGQEGGDMTAEFTWNGDNDGGQNITPGLYYIKVSFIDTYDHVQTTIKDVQVVRIDKKLRVSIYNSAGEAVRRITADYVPHTLGDLGLLETAGIGKGSSPIDIEYAPGAVVQWDGKNDGGRLVDSGVYEVRVELNSGSGYYTSAAKKITVLNSGNADWISGFKSFPNPVYVNPAAGRFINIAWASAASGKIRADIYNEAGELVRGLEGTIQSGSMQWNLKTATDKPVSVGVYVAVVRAIKDTGEIKMETLKFSVLYKQ